MRRRLQELNRNETAEANYNVKSEESYMKDVSQGESSTQKEAIFKEKIKTRGHLSYILSNTNSGTMKGSSSKKSIAILSDE